MTKKELEQLVKTQKKQIELLNVVVELQKQLLYKYEGELKIEFDPDACPMGGKHDFNTHTSGGWVCKCGKTAPHVSFPSTISFDGPKM